MMIFWTSSVKTGCCCESERTNCGLTLDQLLTDLPGDGLNRRRGLEVTLQTHHNNTE